VGGWLFSIFGWGGASGVNLYSILVATLGAVVFLWIWKALTVRRAV
ncbi:MAG TPA: GlsB/YeaQ/YmgE family stress response membrane protein, partial [bacterium]|nr:GlsB/YeaQ/YmgE family stress response membrane protein [bacterium]